MRGRWPRVGLITPPLSVRFRPPRPLPGSSAGRAPRLQRGCRRFETVSGNHTKHTPCPNRSGARLQPSSCGFESRRRVHLAPSSSAVERRVYIPLAPDKRQVARSNRAWGTMRIEPGATDTRITPGAPRLRSSIGTRAPGFYPGGCRFESCRGRHHGRLKGIGIPACLRNRRFSVRLRGRPPIQTRT